MSPEKKRNFGHSAYSRLLTYAKSKELDFTFVLQRYGMERLIHRMSISPYADEFVLKGASLFLVWKGQSFRVTKDADFLNYKFHSEMELARIFKEICSISGYEEDGIVFDSNSIKARLIREEQEYGGIRITLLAGLHNARIALQIDIGYGDAVTPSPEPVTYPTILDNPAPHLRAYTRYSVVAEKLNAMTELGLANSRMKDFYDIWLMSNIFEFNFLTLRTAIKDTFKRRKTDIPTTIPLALTATFSEDSHKRAQWTAFIRKSKPDSAQNDFSIVVNRIAEFLLPVLASVLNDKPKKLHWSRSTGWKE